jgi:hypothetical protein
LNQPSSNTCSNPSHSVGSPDTPLFESISIAESLKLLYRPTKGAITFTLASFLLIGATVTGLVNHQSAINQRERIIQQREEFSECYQKLCPYRWNSKLQQFVFTCTQQQSLEAEKCCKE